MDPGNGDIYPSVFDARRAGVKDPVEIRGSEAAIQSISSAVRDKAKARRKAQKKARKINRGA